MKEGSSFIVRHKAMGVGLVVKFRETIGFF